jgi:hypothetical protein
MGTYRRLGRAAGAAILAGTSLASAFVTFAPPAEAEPVSVTDAVGDTVTDVIEDPISVPSADIVATAADSKPEGITLSFRTTKMVDPAADRNWLSVFTSARWELDTNGDAKRDYVLDYYRDEDTQALTADLDKSGPGYPPDDCQPPPAYSPDSGYSVVILPKCLGGATNLTYRVFLDYTVDAEDPGADIGTDVSPDQGWTGPVPITLAAGVTPVTLVPAVSSTPVAPQQTGGSDAPTAPTTARTSPSTADTPKAGGPGVTSTRPTAPTRGPASAGAPGPASDQPPAPDLAHTGLSDRFLRLAGFAVGIALIGIGLLFANRRPSLS